MIILSLVIFSCLNFSTISIISSTFPFLSHSFCFLFFVFVLDLDWELLIRNIIKQIWYFYFCFQLLFFLAYYAQKCKFLNCSDEQLTLLQTWARAEIEFLDKFWTLYIFFSGLQQRLQHPSPRCRRARQTPTATTPWPAWSRATSTLAPAQPIFSKKGLLGSRRYLMNYYKSVITLLQYVKVNFCFSEH